MYSIANPHLSGNGGGRARHGGVGAEEEPRDEGKRVEQRLLRGPRRRRRFRRPHRCCRRCRRRASPGGGRPEGVEELSKGGQRHRLVEPVAGVRPLGLRQPERFLRRLRWA